MRLVADAAVAAALDGAEFSLRDVHDVVWRNGNVPMSLLRWELLGDRGDVDAARRRGPVVGGAAAGLTGRFRGRPPRRVGGGCHSGAMAGHTHRIPHTLDYVELSVTDMQAARDFYGAAFGWTFTSYGDGYSGIRTSAESDGDEAGGLSLAEQVVRGGPLVLLYSDDLDATLAAVQSAGGEIVNGPYEFPGGRRFHFVDPSGNELGVWAAA